MKPIKITKQPVVKPETDWSEPQWVRCTSESQLVVLTTGKHADFCFEGTALPCFSNPGGKYSTSWVKSQFAPIEAPLLIEISN